MSPYLHISDWIIIILIRTISRNKHILDSFRKKLYFENKEYFDLCNYIPDVHTPFRVHPFLSLKNSSLFFVEILRALFHLILDGSIRIYQIFYKNKEEKNDKEKNSMFLNKNRKQINSWIRINDTIYNPSCDKIKEKVVNEPNRFINKNHDDKFESLHRNKDDNYFFISTYTDHIGKKIICSHLLNIYTALEFAYKIINKFQDCELEMQIWNQFYQILLIFQQKYPFFFLPFSKNFDKYFKEYQKKNFTIFEFYYLLYGLNKINEYEKYNLDEEKQKLFNNNDKAVFCDFNVQEIFSRKSNGNLLFSLKNKSMEIYKYNILGYVKLVHILKSIRNPNKLKKKFIQITYIKYLVKYIHHFLRKLIIDISNTNTNYFKNSILFDLKNIFIFFYGYGIPPFNSKKNTKVYKPHYSQLNNITSRGVPINDLIKFLRTYYDNNKLLEWKKVASEFVNVLKNMKELQLFIDSPTISLNNYNFVKENTWLTLISAKLRNDIYKLPMDLKRDIILLLKNIRSVDLCSGTNHYEYVNNIFNVCWFIIVKIFQNYEKSKKNT